jgi:hypothetical protein
LSISTRRRFLDYVRRVPGAAPVVSPFLPKPELLEKTLRHLGFAVKTGDPVENEIRLSHALDYEPMFMTDLGSLIFPPEANLSNGPVLDESGLKKLVAFCEHVSDREKETRSYYRNWRERVGEEGVIVIGHPQIPWLTGQVSQQDMVYVEQDFPQVYRNCMEAILKAALFVFEIAMQEGIDFMSEGGYGLEMVSPAWYEKYDLYACPGWALLAAQLRSYTPPDRNRDLQPPGC